jgi:hypothetical protein
VNLTTSQSWLKKRNDFVVLSCGLSWFKVASSRFISSDPCSCHGGRCVSYIHGTMSLCIPLYNQDLKKIKKIQPLSRSFFMRFVYQNIFTSPLFVFVIFFIYELVTPLLNVWFIFKREIIYILDFYNIWEKCALKIWRSS